MGNRKTIIWTLTVALAGFLFGFDTIVISGAEKTLQELWNSSDLFHGWVVVSSALWGTVIGALFGGIPTDKIGRKRTLFWIGILYSISAIGSGLANGSWVFAFFRFLGGLGVGASTIAAPAYISEIAPASKRGRLVALYQFNIVFGILVAFASNYFFLENLGPQSWRWMIGIEALPAILYTVLVNFVPRSPRWLITKMGAEAEAREVLSQIAEPEEIERLVNEIKATTHGVQSESLFQAKFNRLIWLAFFISFFNQFSGINAFLYYSPRIFEASGMAESSAFISSFGVGAVNLIFTLLGMLLIDKLGRKTLLYIGSVGYIVSLGLVGGAFLYEWGGGLIPFFFFLFIAAHAIGQGAVIWVFISEIFPNTVRARGQALGTSTHWVLAAIIPALTPWLFKTVGVAPVFLFFCFMMILQLIWVAFFVPETKGKSLEQLENELSKEYVQQ